jgi:hypothetical protein
MKWDDAADPDDIDDEDKVAFEGLRKVYFLLCRQIRDINLSTFSVFRISGHLWIRF